MSDDHPNKSFGDPRLGDFEDDVSSTKQRSLLSIAGSMLSEISIPKLIFAWVLSIALPAILLGLAPLVATAWAATLTDEIASFTGVGAVLLLMISAVIGWFGWRPLLRMAETNFWSLNALAVQPGYAFCPRGDPPPDRTGDRPALGREGARQVAGDQRRGGGVAALRPCTLRDVSSCGHRRAGRERPPISWLCRTSSCRQSPMPSFIVSGLYGRRGADLGHRRCHHGSAARSFWPSTSFLKAHAAGVSHISPTYTWSASAMASASRAGASARAAMTASSLPWIASPKSTPRTRSISS